MPKTEYMNLQQLLSTYSPLYPEGYNWSSTLAYLQANPADKKVLDQLSAVLLQGDKFRNSVTLGLAESAEGVEFQAVTNGTHRVCAHILTGVTEVEVRAERVRGEDPLPLMDIYSTDITFERSLSEREIDLLFDSLRSFPLNDTFWLTSDVSSYGAKMFNLMWDFEEADKLPEVKEIDFIVQGVLDLIGDLPKATNVLTISSTFDE